ncbi:MAG: hypothetical protein WD231_04160 [Candidatus Woykebacteria bacterium]
MEIGDTIEIPGPGVFKCLLVAQVPTMANGDDLVSVAAFALRKTRKDETCAVLLPGGMVAIGVKE